MTKCSRCSFEMSGSEDESNDGLCDWCEERLEEAQTKENRIVRLRGMKLLATEKMVRRF